MTELNAQERSLAINEVRTFLAKLRFQIVLFLPNLLLMFIVLYF